MSDNKQKGENMDIDNLTVKEINHILFLLMGSGDNQSPYQVGNNYFIRTVTHILSLLMGSGDNQSPYQVGKNYFIRTVTHHYTGKLIRVTPKELVLEKAAWIADDGRFMNAIREGKLNEVEPFHDEDEVIVGRGAVLDATIWRHALPREQK